MLYKLLFVFLNNQGAKQGKVRQIMRGLFGGTKESGF